MVYENGTAACNEGYGRRGCGFCRLPCPFEGLAPSTLALLDSQLACSPGTRGGRHADHLFTRDTRRSPRGSPVHQGHEEVARRVQDENGAVRCGATLAQPDCSDGGAVLDGLSRRSPRDSVQELQGCAGTGSLGALSWALTKAR